MHRVRFGDMQQHFLAAQLEHVRGQKAALRIGLAAVQIDLNPHVGHSDWHDVIAPDIVRNAQVIHSHSGFEGRTKVAREEPLVKLRKTPSQARSAWTVDLILQAAAQVLEARGEDALTTKTVAERAGVSIGTLYQYFPNRDAILVALADREAQRIGERIRALIDRHPDNREDPGRVMVKALIRSYAARRGATPVRFGGHHDRQDWRLIAAQRDCRISGTDLEPVRCNGWNYYKQGLCLRDGQRDHRSPVLKEPDLEDALCNIIAALHPTGRRLR